MEPQNSRSERILQCTNTLHSDLEIKRRKPAVALQLGSLDGEPFLEVL